jgi:acetyltransferase-like isoleucine patch superfamily enzyme
MVDNIFFDVKKLKYLGEGAIIGKTVRIRKPEECYIGDGVIIDDFTYISCPVHIARNCHISSHCSISGGAGSFKMGYYSTLSSHVSVHTCSSDYKSLSMDLPSVPRDLQFGGEVGHVELGNFVTIGSHSVILPNVILPEGFACGAFTLLNAQEYKKNGLYVGIPAKFRTLRDYKELQEWKIKNNVTYIASQE